MLTRSQTRGAPQGEGCCLLRAQEAGCETAIRGEEEREGRQENGAGPRGLRLLEDVAMRTLFCPLCDFTLDWRGGSGHQFICVGGLG